MLAISEIDFTAGLTAIFIYLLVAVVGIMIVVAPLFCWIHLSQINKKMDKLVAAADHHPLTADGIGAAVARVISGDEEPLVRTIVEARDRTVVCNDCGKSIKIAANSRFKPGDTAHCPGCKALIRV